MMHKLSTPIVIALMLIMAISTSAKGETKLSEKVKPQSGFLPDYSILQPVKSPDGTKAYRYTKIDFDPLMYNAVIIDSVIINQGEVDEKITPDIVEQTRTALAASIRDRIGQSTFKIADEPASDVLRIAVSISGADLESEGFKPRNILPISAALKVVSYAVGKEKKSPVLLVESKITDSKTGVIVRAGMITISGEAFRDAAKTSEQFQNLVQKIVGLAMQNSER